MVTVIATIECQPGQREAFLAEFRQIVPQVRAEAGCVRYFPAIDADTDIPNQSRSEDRVTIVEEWETVEHLKAHLQAPHMLEYRPRVQDLVKSAELRVLSEA